MYIGSSIYNTKGSIEATSSVGYLVRTRFTQFRVKGILPSILVSRYII